MYENTGGTLDYDTNHNGNVWVDETHRKKHAQEAFKTLNNKKN